jgi:putative ABC transport system substrate-binding protein
VRPFWPLSISRLIPSLGSRDNRHDSDHRNMRNAAFARGVEARLPCMNKCLAIVYKLPWVVSMNRNECALMIMYGRKTNCHGLKSRTSCSAFRKIARPCLPRLLMVARPNPCGKRSMGAIFTEVGSALARLIAVLMILCLVAPRAAVAQQTASVSHIGLLAVDTESHSREWLETFRASLRDFGYVEGKNLVIEYRWADDQNDRLSALAAELVRLKVDVIVTYSTQGALAAKRATTTIPIVMAASTDAVRTGIVASLARPGGNITGWTFLGPELYVKQLELLKLAVPDLKRVAHIFNPANTAVAAFFKEEQQAAASLKIELSHLEARQPGDFDAVFASAVTKGIEAVVISSNPMLVANSEAIAKIAARLPRRLGAQWQVVAPRTAPQQQGQQLQTTRGTSAAQPFHRVGVLR